MNIEQIYLRLVILGFLLSLIIAQLAKFFTGFRELLSNPMFAVFIIFLTLGPLFLLLLWARLRKNRDIWRMILAIVPSLLIVYFHQYMTSAFGWLRGSSILPSGILQAVIYGTSTVVIIIALMSIYRLLSKANKIVAVVYYLSVLVLSIGFTYFSHIFQSRFGLAVFQANYSLQNDISIVLVVFSLPLVLYEILNFVSYGQVEIVKELEEALDRINKAIHSTLDFDVIMKSVVREAAQVLRAESAAIAIYEEGNWFGRYQFGLLMGAKTRLSEDEARMAAFGFKIYQPQGIRDVYADPRMETDIIEKYHFRSILAIPLRVRKDFIGVLTFNYHTRQVVFTEAQFEFAARLQTTVSLALQNARLYGKEKHAASLSNALNQINLAISSSRDINEIMNLTINAAAKAIGCETAAITLKEEEHWVLRHNYGFSKKYIGQKFTEEEARHTVYAARTREPLVINDALNDERINIEIAKSLKIRSVVIMPLSLRNEIIGVLSFNYHSDAIAFTEVQIDFLKKVASALSLAIENTQLYASQRNIADTLQKSVLSLPQKIRGIEFAHLYHSATATAEVGGDFYDLFEMENNKIAIVIGDVSGKGLKAATLTALIKSTIKAYAHVYGSTADIVKKTSDILVRESGIQTFVTMFFGILNLKTGQLKYCGAGHPPPLIKRLNKAHFLSSESSITGFQVEAAFVEQETTLEVGDVLLLYTDGVIEARKDAELFGEKRLAKAVIESKSLAETPQHIIERVLKFSGSQLSDDIAILALKRT